MNDDEWRRNVDEHLLRDLIEDLQERVKEIDVILMGERGKGGLIAEYERHDEKLTRLYAVIFQDPTGQKGLIHDVDYLMGRREDRRRSVQFKWQFWTAILVALITSVTALVTNWETIKKNFLASPGPLEEKIERAKRPRSPKKIYRYRILPKKESAESSEAPTPNEPPPK